jgi:Fe-S cluster assembly protein SufB
MDLDSANLVEYELYLKGLSENTVRSISSDLNEPDWMLEKRLASLKIFYSLEMPHY